MTAANSEITTDATTIVARTAAPKIPRNTKKTINHIATTVLATTATAVPLLRLHSTKYTAISGLITAITDLHPLRDSPR